MEAFLEVFMSYFGSHRRFSFKDCWGPPPIANIEPQVLPGLLQKPVVSKGMAVPRGKDTIILKLQVTSKDFRYTYPLQSMQAFPGCRTRRWKRGEEGRCMM